MSEINTAWSFRRASETTQGTDRLRSCWGRNPKSEPERTCAWPRSVERVASPSSATASSTGSQGPLGLKSRAELLTEKPRVERRAVRANDMANESEAVQSQGALYREERKEACPNLARFPSPSAPACLACRASVARPLAQESLHLDATSPHQRMFPKANILKPTAQAIVSPLRSFFLRPARPLVLPRPARDSAL